MFAEGHYIDGRYSMKAKEPRIWLATEVFGDRAKQVLLTPHFWGIVFIMAGLITLYNASSLGVERWFPLFTDVFKFRGVYAFVLSFLFLFPILYAGAVFRVRGVFGTWAASIAATLPQLLKEAPDLAFWLSVGLFHLASLLLGLLVALDYNPVSTRSVTRAARTVGRLPISQIVKVHEYQRRHLARELHDRVIQSLLVIANRIHALETGNHGEVPPEAKRQMEEVLVMLLRTVDDIRRLSYGLGSRILDNAGLLPALRWLADQVSNQSGVRVEVRVNGREHRLPPELELVLFRVVQEVLRNVVTHSKASLAVVTLDFLSSEFQVTVEDNGCGFSVPERLGDLVSRGKLGLARIEQEVRLLGGVFDLRSTPGKGTVVKIQIKAWP